METWTVLLQDPLVQYYIAALLVQIPVMRIFERAGFRPWWALLLGMPFIGHILCAAVLACQRWRKVTPAAGGAA